MNLTTDRRSFLAYFSSLGLASTLFPGVLWGKLTEARLSEAQGKPPEAAPALTKDMLRSAAAVAGLEFTDDQLDKMLKGVAENTVKLRDLRKIEIDNNIAPPLYFNPVLPGMKIDRTHRPFRASAPPRVQRPPSLEDVAFWPVTKLGALIRTRQVTSVELTEMYLSRAKRYNARLKCFVTMTDDLALREARQADKEIAAGKYRGPLHGVPYGIKDLFAVKGYPTTWGAAPFKDRIIDADATVVTRLREAGAVLIGKLATGELAFDDIWFGGQTMNPWDPSMGSQGSSAGPGSATAGGLVGFSIGTETLGSILAPSAICGVTGLRPTFGRVSRFGAMALSWSMDKTGPMCRAVEDCALVLNAIQGADNLDLAAVDVPFNWDASLDGRKLRVGYLKAAFENTRQTPQVEANDRAALDKIRSLGIELAEFKLPENPKLDPSAILNAEGISALHDPVDTHPDQLARPDRIASQNAYRLYPAPDYVNANRVRMLLMQEMDRLMANLDVYLLPYDYADYTPNPVADRSTGITNLTGHPSVTLPHGFDEKGHPTGLTFIGKLFGEAQMLALAKAYQDSTGWHLKHPRL
ncbi:MAG TPA: amidase [Candidatus Angelobacter sp.]|jgi:Asp-tRNA(Asn)/Glu-tRNA(Gln) amidotransferase A subunit family amidase